MVNLTAPEAVPSLCNGWPEGRRDRRIRGTAPHATGGEHRRFGRSPVAPGASARLRLHSRRCLLGNPGGTRRVRTVLHDDFPVRQRLVPARIADRCQRGGAAPSAPLGPASRGADGIPDVGGVGSSHRRPGFRRRAGSPARLSVFVLDSGKPLARPIRRLPSGSAHGSRPGCADRLQPREQQPLCPRTLRSVAAALPAVVRVHRRLDRDNGLRECPGASDVAGPGTAAVSHCRTSAANDRPDRRALEESIVLVRIRLGFRNRDDQRAPFALSIAS